MEGTMLKRLLLLGFFVCLLMQFMIGTVYAQAQAKTDSYTLV
jgi:hypothetical protein